MAPGSGQEGLLYGDRSTSWASSESVRRRMQRQPRRDTSAEMALRRELHRRGLRYRVDRPIVPGTRKRRVDVVFPKAKVAVLVDGCYWHGCSEHGRPMPRANATYWVEKIERNVRRDADTNERLSLAGWHVIRIWEHDDPSVAADVVAAAVRSGPLRAHS